MVVRGLIKLGTLAACLLALCTAEPPVNNQYLPPSSSGYNYPSPSVPFPSPPRPPSPPPTQTYRPSPQPSYRPPAPPAPPAPKPTYGAPSPGPSYGPPPVTPSGPNYQPSSNNLYGETSHLNMPHVPGMPYDFNYAVKDDYYGTDYSHNAVSDGDQVKGEYRVQLPDGRLQIVSYVADWATGFHADVRYEGQASYPETNKQGGYPAAGPPAAAYGPPSQGY